MQPADAIMKHERGDLKRAGARVPMSTFGGSEPCSSVCPWCGPSPNLRGCFSEHTVGKGFADPAVFPSHIWRAHRHTKPENGKTYSSQGKDAQSGERKAHGQSVPATEACHSRMRIRPSEGTQEYCERRYWPEGPNSPPVLDRSGFAEEQYSRPRQVAGTSRYWYRPIPEHERLFEQSRYRGMETQGDLCLLQGKESIVVPRSLPEDCKRQRVFLKKAGIHLMNLSNIGRKFWLIQSW